MQSRSRSIGSSLRTEEDLLQLYHRHVATVYRVCFLYMKNAYDAEDMVQNTFVRLMDAAPRFESTEHEKAWLIRTATNLCINQLRHWWRRTSGIDEALETVSVPFVVDETLGQVLALPPKYKAAIYLHYYEGYSTAEVARLLGCNESTLRGHLRVGRQLLKMNMEGDSI